MSLLPYYPEVVENLPRADFLRSEPFPVGDITVCHIAGVHGRVAESLLGGGVIGVGLAIRWQSGPTRVEMFKPDGTPSPSYGRNGAFVDDVLIAARTRLEYHQRTKFACEANEKAIAAIDAALDALAARRRDRIERGVYGQNKK